MTMTPVQISKEKSRIRALLRTDGRTPEEAQTYREKGMKLLEKHGWTEADLVIKMQQKPNPEPKPEPKKPEPKAKKPRAGGARRGPAPTYADDQVITILVSNPKRPGSLAHGRFAKYRDQMTVGQAIEAGLTRDDFRWDIAHGHISIK